MGKHRTLEEKIEIISFNEQGHSISEVCKEFGIGHTSVCEFYRDRDEIRARYYAERRRWDGANAAAGVEVIPEELMPRRVSADDLKQENKALKEENEFLKDKVAYLEALYEVLKQDSLAVPKKMIFGDQESVRGRKAQRQTVVRHGPCLAEVLLPEPQAEEEGGRGLHAAGSHGQTAGGAWPLPGIQEDGQGGVQGGRLRGQ